MPASADTPVEQLPVTHLKGVGPNLAARLHTLGVHTVLDLLFHLPLRYQDRTKITAIGGLRQGADVVIEGTIAGSAVMFGKRRSLMVKVQDGTGVTSLRFFHFSAAQKTALANGLRIRCYGEVRYGKSGVEMYHPEYQLILATAPLPLQDRLTPVYPATEGLQQTRLRNLVTQVFALLEQSQALPDLLPVALAKQYAFLPLLEARRFIYTARTSVW